MNANTFLNRIKNAIQEKKDTIRFTQLSETLGTNQHKEILKSIKSYINTCDDLQKLQQLEQDALCIQRVYKRYQSALYKRCMAIEAVKHNIQNIEL